MRLGEEMLVFEAALSRTHLGPEGETPVLQYSFSWKQLSVIAGLSHWRFYFRLYAGTIRTPQVIEFLQALQATIGKKLLIICAATCSGPRAARTVDSLPGRLSPRPSTVL